MAARFEMSRERRTRCPFSVVKFCIWQPVLRSSRPCRALHGRGPIRRAQCASSSALLQAAGGNGSAGHVSGELFKLMTGVNLVHVPYRGAAPALAELLGGQVQVIFSDTSSIEYIKAGKLRALAVTAATRSQALPDTPTVG